ncbi:MULTISPECIES: thiol:disulfide interchange protein DsbA/DsbL [unclassified Janthinobacterium]|uniref:thiol:disulfide interchange protein DsbA/DsbL n=1 Tax=unclassified Janthinobacterium TaxID=2610881 RepID=UPI00034A97BC|nr:MULTISPECIES: thiol:disulfide interchange protein DsbA/DsbL [unclassified Janthinobacterium]MEC5163631.1 thiol:disulfide interchange protein DsbA [Janthinobacterium sp. CG_S6]
MRFLRLLLAAVTLMASTSGAFAAEPKNGVDYTTLESMNRPDTGKKIEVIEFFMYSCPHCYALEPLMSEWVKKQGDKIAFRRVHMAFSGPQDPQAHAYVTLEAMGKLELLHDKIFRAIHVERNRLNKDEALTAFIAQNGVDKAQYLEFFNSFAVQTKMKRGVSQINTFKLTSAPSIVIDGRFVTSPSMAGRPGQTETQSQQATIQVLDALVAKALRESGKGAADVAAKPVKK